MEALAVTAEPRLPSGGQFLRHAPYPDYANPQLLEKIPLTAHTVLDVGCAQGALGAAYLRRNPRACVLGIDTDAAALGIAANRLTATACADVEATPLPFVTPNGLDCIIYGDILEHLADPWTLLARHAERLAPGGTVLVCMPNVEHWQLARLLLNGGFDYQDSGLLDRTHLRWFTPRNMGRALRQAGLDLADLAPRPIDPTGAEKFVQAMAPSLRALGIDPQEYLGRAWPLQFIWRARKPGAPRRLFINATALPPQGGVSEVRILQPLAALRSDSAILGRVTPEPDLPQMDAETPHIAILHRPLLLGDAGLTRIKSLLAKNYLIVTEFDDHPNFMAARGVPVAELLSFKAVHAIQTTTLALAAALRPQNPEIAIFPNAILELPEIRNFTSPERLTLFFGALNREEDWPPLLPVLNEIAELAGARLHFSVLHDQAFFDALETPHKTFTPIADYPTYLRLLAAAEIAFLPLADSEFNRAKSDLKFIEAAACRVAVLASPVVYAGVIAPGKTGYLFNDQASLRAYLGHFIDKPDAARQIADAARHYVATQRMLAYQLPERSAWYRRLWQNRAALTQALRQRMPELFD